MSSSTKYVSKRAWGGYFDRLSNRGFLCSSSRTKFVSRRALTVASIRFATQQPRISMLVE
ncbi:hypothetical protein [Melioribacter sp. OK-6-Me]|uniref:hypothetical protein n=1 Tax=unclassified Melioribacter TaxID=2627329 RepID=UPI003ED91CBC